VSYEEHPQDSALASTFGPDGQRQPFNLSRWALRHGPLTRYLMIVMLFLGAVAYFQLGQDEDPPFTFRAMVVQAYWPGASAKDMAE
jgi:multidrug efflux pump